MLTKIKELWVKPPTWQQFHAIGNSGLAKATILMPLIGYLIIFNDNLIQYLNLSEAYVWDVGLLISYKIFLFYFGLTFISIGAIIFNIACPNTIKMYPDILNYINLESENMNEVLRDYFRKRIDEKTKEIEEAGVPIAEYFRDLIREGKDAKVGRPDPIKSRTLLRVYWSLENALHKRLRLLMTFFYAIGFLLLVIPAIDTFAGVCIALMARLIS